VNNDGIGSEIDDMPSHWLADRERSNQIIFDQNKILVEVKIAKVDKIDDTGGI
jgi:hypothetical protein